jgi:hypothetical protein
LGHFFVQGAFRLVAGDSLQRHGEKSVALAHQRTTKNRPETRSGQAASQNLTTKRADAVERGGDAC